MTFTALGFDVDGVLVDSRATAFRTAERIAAIFGMSETIGSMRAYRATFEALERAHAPELESAASLRALHRLGMRATAGTIPVFNSVAGLLRRAQVPVCAISSALRATVITALGDAAPAQEFVLAHEDGLKEQNLARWSAGQRALYVTDNIRDVEHCHGCGVAVVAVGWGYDDTVDLLAARPDWFVEHPANFEHLLSALNLIGAK